MLLSHRQFLGKLTVIRPSKKKNKMPQNHYSTWFLAICVLAQQPITFHQDLTKRDTEKRSKGATNK